MSIQRLLPGKLLGAPGKALYLSLLWLICLPLAAAQHSLVIEQALMPDPPALDITSAGEPLAWQESESGTLWVELPAELLPALPPLTAPPAKDPSAAERPEPSTEAAASTSSDETALQRQLAAAQERIERLEKGQNELLAARLAQSKLQDLRERVQQAVDLLGAQPSQAITAPSSPTLMDYLPWIVAGVSLLLGLIAGAYIVDYRVRKKFGGIRI